MDKKVEVGWGFGGALGGGGLNIPLTFVVLRSTREYSKGSLVSQWLYFSFPKFRRYRGVIG